MLTTVGFDPSKNLTHIHYAFASGASSIATRFVAQPFDVIKIRFQLQVEPISKLSINSKYKGFNHAIHTIFKEEGITALWKGHIPGQVLSIFYGAAQFISFERLTEIIYINSHNFEIEKKSFNSVKHNKYSKKKNNENHETENQVFVHLFCGSLSGCFATATSFPLDVIRTRLISQGSPKVYNGIFDAVIKIFKKEGIKGFYKGIVPSIIQIIPFSGLVFGFNRLFKQFWPNNLHNNNISTKFNSPLNDIMESAVCGAASGFFAKSVVYPLDLLKKRLQVQDFGYARKDFGAHHDYTSLADGIKKILKTESISGFYKGFYPSVLKSAASTAIQFVVYEQIIRIMMLNNKK